MLNNKYLAVVLAVLAVGVVIYQVFFSKPAKPPARQVNPAAVQPRPAVSPSPVQKTAPEKDGALIIDFASPILLKRVYENPMEKFPGRELPDQFGRAIFSPPPGRELETPTDTGDQTHLQFRLNSIIIDKGRRIAVINNTILFTGETIDGARVESIQKNRVLLKLRDRDIVLSTEPGLSTIRLTGGKSDG